MELFSKWRGTPSKPDPGETHSFVTALYRGILRRDPDREGLDYFVTALLNGRTHASVVAELIGSVEFKNQTAVKLFVPPGHYYSPIVDPAQADRHLATAFAVPESIAEIEINRVEMVQFWHTLLPFLTSAPFSDTRKPPFRYLFNNRTYSWGDGSVLHAMLRFYRPKRLIEIGSGWSSACTLDTAQFYLNNECELTFVEPYPLLLSELLADAASRARIFEAPVQDVPLKIFKSLQAGDILFIDSTHVMKTGSDVCFELFEILPCLAPGVLVHFHDIFWPFEYPRLWAVEENRSWNELYAVRALLSRSNKLRILLFNDYLAQLERAMIETTYPQFLRDTGSALWLQKL